MSWEMIKHKGELIVGEDLYYPQTLIFDESRATIVYREAYSRGNGYDQAALVAAAPDAIDALLLFEDLPLEKLLDSEVFGEPAKVQEAITLMVTTLTEWRKNCG